MSVHFSSNQEEVGSWLIHSLDDFGFDSPGPGGKPLGEELVDNHVEMIRQRTFAGEGLDGPLPANTKPYASRKLAETGSDLTNVYSGEMLSTESVRGQVTIGKRELLHVYGTRHPGDPEAGRIEPAKPSKRRRKTRRPTNRHRESQLGRRNRAGGSSGWMIR